ncbi:MAG: nucleotidyltransferase family protein, partial [Acutalibacteraceae bacterium]
MKIAGVVCEYNPMHNGHVYHLKKTREAGATHIVCALSSDFVQRGECAYLDKFTRADIAVHCGADLVVEIPVIWSSSAAESYALGAVSILDSLGCDFLSFGAETDDKKLLSDCAGIMENEAANERIRRYLSQGNSYPAAVSKAAENIFGQESAAVFSSPNSTLALEYIRTLQKIASQMDFLPVRRFGAAHDSEKSDGITASASLLRSLEEFESLKRFMPF